MKPYKVLIDENLVRLVPRRKLSEWVREGLLWRIGVAYGISDFGKLLEMVESDAAFQGVPEELRARLCVLATKLLLKKYGADKLMSMLGIEKEVSHD